jgi:hypothetical protein
MPTGVRNSLRCGTVRSAALYFLQAPTADAVGFILAGGVGSAEPIDLAQGHSFPAQTDSQVSAALRRGTWATVESTEGTGEHREKNVPCHSNPRDSSLSTPVRAVTNDYISTLLTFGF